MLTQPRKRRAAKGAEAGTEERTKEKESIKIEEFQSQMATQSAQITSLLGKFAEMIAQSKIKLQTTKGAEQQRVGMAITTTKAYEKKRQTRGREQRVLKSNRLVKGCARVGITLYPDKYPDVGTRAQLAQWTCK